MQYIGARVVLNDDGDLMTFVDRKIESDSVLELPVPVLRGSDLAVVRERVSGGGGSVVALWKYESANELEFSEALTWIARVKPDWMYVKTEWGAFLSLNRMYRSNIVLPG